MRFAVMLAALAIAGCALVDPDPGPAGYTPSGSDAGVPPGVPVHDPNGGGGAGGAGGAGGGGEAPGGAGGEGPVDPQVLEGQVLYFQYCAVCHGADGSGAPPFPESIQGATDMLEIVQQGEAEMPAFPQLTAADVLAMEAYLATFVGGGEGGGGIVPPPPEPTTPREIYAHECAGCHGADGAGAALGPQLLSPVRGYARWVTRNGRSGVGYRRAMPAYDTEALSDVDLDAILAWLGEAPKPSDGAGLYTRFCANCHGADGRGGPTRAGIRGEDLDEWIEVIREGEGGRDYGDRGDYMPRWSAAEITDAEILLMYQALNGGGTGGAGGTGGMPGDPDDDRDDDVDEDADEDVDEDSDEDADEDSDEDSDEGADED